MTEMKRRNFVATCLGIIGLGRTSRAAEPSPARGFVVTARTFTAGSTEQDGLVTCYAKSYREVAEWVAATPSLRDGAEESIWLCRCLGSSSDSVSRIVMQCPDWRSMAYEERADTIEWAIKRHRLQAGDVLTLGNQCSVVTF